MMAQQEEELLKVLGTIGFHGQDKRSGMGVALMNREEVTHEKGYQRAKTIN